MYFTFIHWYTYFLKFDKKEQLRKIKIGIIVMGKDVIENSYA